MRKSNLTEPVELCQRGVDVAQTEHTIMQMKTTDYMREVNIELVNCNRNLVTGHSLIRKNA